MQLMDMEKAKELIGKYEDLNAMLKEIEDKKYDDDISLYYIKDLKYSTDLGTPRELKFSVPCGVIKQILKTEIEDIESRIRKL